MKTSNLPLIGITTTRRHRESSRPPFYVNRPYKDSITHAGGSIELIPLDLSSEDLDIILSRLDGILFTGGSDVDPQCYGGQAHRKVKGIDPDRDRTELHLLRQALRRELPFLGICRGIQVINVALGGSLYEDIPEQFPGALEHDHHGLPRDHQAHPVEVVPGSHLAEILATQQTLVNSLHHQGIRKLAPDVVPTAYAPDGLIEAFELPAHHFGMAVQWHPEEMQAHASMRWLFEAFVQACQAGNSS